MRCPFCKYTDTHVKDSRPSDDGDVIKRRRFCEECKARFTTFERIEHREFKVVKKNGNKRIFDSSKLLKSLEIAARKRFITSEKLEQIVTTIINNIQRLDQDEIPSVLIGKMAMSELTKIDLVSYIRYASVYMDFKSTDDFSNFIKSIDGPM